MSVETKTKKEPARQPAGLIAQKFLHEMLMRNECKPGEPVRETVLSERWGLSRNAIREALNQMVAGGIMEYIPYSGYRVRNFTLHDFLEWREMREAIEPIAARRLARLRPPAVIARLEAWQARFEASATEKERQENDLQFHLAIVEHCGNRTFARQQTISVMMLNFFASSLIEHKFDNVRSDDAFLYPPARPTPDEYTAQLLRLTIESHRLVLDSIKAGDAATAEREIRQHAAIQVGRLEDIIRYAGGDSVTARSLM